MKIWTAGDSEKMYNRRNQFIVRDVNRITVSRMLFILGCYKK